MSDIDIHLYGLVLDAAVALTAILYALIALGAGAFALAGRASRNRAWRVANTAGLCFLGNGAILAVLLIFYDGPEPIWRDWLAIPWLLLFVGSAFRIFRRPRANADPTP